MEFYAERPPPPQHTPEWHTLQMATIELTGSDAVNIFVLDGDELVSWTISLTLLSLSLSS